MNYFDAHNHLQDVRLAPQRASLLEKLPHLSVRNVVVNGTSEADWDEVAELAAHYDWITPAFGLHPWFVEKRSSNWRDKLRVQLDANPRAVIGEIGLDRWIEPHDFPLQLDVFEWQLHLAAERNLPASIHCLKAWGALWDLIREHPLPARGFLLHSFSGPAEMVQGFVQRGGYFSFSPYFLHERKSATREIFRSLPIERLLIETDAPDMAPPADFNLNPLPDIDGKPLNHPANLALAYSAIADLRDLSLESLAVQIEKNFTRIFG